MSDKPIKILLVEDNIGDARFVKEMLAEATTVQFELAHVEHLNKALKSLAKEKFDIILLDLTLPDVHGLDTVIQTRIAVPNIPIVVMSGLSDEELAIKAVQEGAQDYMVKGYVDSNLLVRSIHYAIERKRAEEALRVAAWEWRATFDAVKDAIALMDMEGRILRCNRAMANLLGKPFSDIIGSTCRSISESIEVCFKRMQETRRRENMILPIEDRWFNVTVDPMLEVPASFAGTNNPVGGVCIISDITRRKQAEEALQRANDELEMRIKERTADLANSEKKYRMLIEQASDGIFILDPQGNIINVNSMACQMLGFTNEEFLRLNLRDLIPADDLAAVPFRINEVLAGEKVVIERRLYHKDGMPIAVEISAKLIEDGRVQTIVRDITERKKAEKALRESEERYRRMVGAVTAYTYSVEVNGGLAVSTHHSMGCLPVTGYHPDDYKSDPYLWHLMIHPDDRLMVEGAVKEILAGREVLPIEHRLIRREGSVVWVRNTMVPYRDENGRVIRYDGLIEDITERKKAEKALQDSKAMYAAIVEGFDGFIYIYSENHEIEFMNERLIERTGYNAIGQMCYKALHGLEDICPWCEKGDEVVRREMHSQEDNHWYYIVTTPIHKQDGSISRMVMIQDITEKKENEMRLIMSERLAALGQMASGIAHEINNPLATIAACAEGLLSRMKKGRSDPELLESYLKIIDEEIARCKGITTSMLSFVKKTTYEKRDVDINYILDKALELISFQGRLNRIEVIRNYKEIPVVHGSEGELRQVFLSIIVNALDAMEDKGTLTLETGIIPSNPPGCEKDEGERVFIKINDTGPGIPSETISRIFDPFFTTKSEKGGIGLGLSIANKIITDNNGHIEATSEKGKGATFKIIMPV